MLFASVMALGLVETTSHVANDLTGGVQQSTFNNLWENSTLFKSTGPGEWAIEQCFQWRRPHHLYYQIGNAFLLLAFLAPNSSCGMLMLRCFLIIGCILLSMWGYLIECSMDTVIWSTLFLIVNVVYGAVLICRLRPVKFDKEIEAVSHFKLYIYLKCV
jgi:blood vessel epicardial substance